MYTLYPPCELLDVGLAVLKVVLMVLVLKAGLLEDGFTVLEAGLLEDGFTVLEVGLLEEGFTVLEVGLLEEGLTVLKMGLLEEGLTVLEMGFIILEDSTKSENVLVGVIGALPAEFTATTLMV